MFMKNCAGHELIFWQINRSLNLEFLGSLCSRNFSQFLMDYFETLQVYYRHIKGVHEDF